MDELLKKAIMIAHNNTHSTSRIFRNVELIKREDIDFSVIENRLNAIELATRECRQQVDSLYNLIKEYENK
jgi:hypothetical protein